MAMELYCLDRYAHWTIGGSDPGLCIFAGWDPPDHYSSGSNRRHPAVDHRYPFDRQRSMVICRSIIAGINSPSEVLY